MAHCGYITTLKNVRPHPNADRLVLATCFDNTVCVAKDKYVEGEIGVYFETDLQLSMEFCEKNGLLAVYDDKGKNISGGYLDPAKRNIRSIKLRGEASDGLFLPLQCLMYTGVDMDTLNIGDTITVVNGHPICQKFIPKRATPRTSAGGAGKRVKRRAKRSIAPVFFEHKDTEQLQYYLNMFKPRDQIEITRKLHGTSGRTSHTKVFQGMKRTWKDKFLRREGTPIYDWGYVTGTRRTVIDTFEEGGFYGSHEFREKWHKFFEGKLWKGETVYYEIVGFTHDGTPIMATCDNKRLKDKEFVKKYGEITTFAYGCHPDGKEVKYGFDDQGQFAIETEIPQSKMFVYRMTMTTEDGDVVEYTPDFMRHRCEQMGADTVPVEWTGIIPEEEIFTGVSCELTDPGEFVMTLAKMFYDGPEPLDPSHIREGVVVRIINRPNFTAYKHKNFEFKVLEGIIKEVAEEPDMEEADGLDDFEAETE